MITRRIGRLLRGRQTPAQIMMACVLGSMIGFTPGFSQAAGLLVALTMLLVVLNANLFLAATSGLLAMLIALSLMPVTFAVGEFLLDGPAQQLFVWLVNAPVFALFGFEYYLTTGGIVMGLIIGGVLGVLTARMLTSFRRKMSDLEQNSERFVAFNSRLPIQVFKFIFVGGGHGKLTYEQLAAKKIGNPFRIIGVVAVALALVLILIVHQFASGPFVMMALQRGLERANGATVDMESAELNLGEGRLSIAGLAMADANDLDVDLFRAENLEAAISATDLLRKRLAMDQVTFSNATSGERRAIRGRHIGPPPQPSKDDPRFTLPDGETLGEYLKNAQQWHERLAQVREWIERISGPEEDADEPVPGAEPLRDRLRRQIREQGYAWVKASHLIEGAPTFIVYQLDAEKVRTTYLDGATIDIHARNLSTHPHLAEEPASVRIESSDDRFRAHLSLDHIVNPQATSTMGFAYAGLPGDTLGEWLTPAMLTSGGGGRDRTPIRGGTIDVVAEGSYSGAGWIELPLTATLNDVRLSIFGSTARRVDRLTVPIGVRGPIDQPRIMLDNRQLADALIAAGQSELAGRLQQEIDKKIGEKIGEKLDGKLPASVGDALKGVGTLLPGSRKSE